MAKLTLEANNGLYHKKVVVAAFQSALYVRFIHLGFKIIENRYLLGGTW
jgi:hypothetical protein